MRSARRVPFLLTVALAASACSQAETPDSTPSTSAVPSETVSSEPTTPDETAAPTPEAELVPTLAAPQPLGSGIPFLALPDGTAIALADDEQDGPLGCEGVDLEVPWLLTGTSRTRMFEPQLEVIDEDPEFVYTIDQAPAPNGGVMHPDADQVLLTSTCEGYLGRMWVAPVAGGTVGELRELDIWDQEVFLTSWGLDWSPAGDLITGMTEPDFSEDGEIGPVTAVSIDPTTAIVTEEFSAADLVGWEPLPATSPIPNGHVRVVRPFDETGVVTVHDADGTVLTSMPGEEFEITTDGLMIVTNSEGPDVRLYDLADPSVDILLFEGEAFDLRLSPFDDLVAFTTPEANGSRLTIATFDGNDTKRIETAGFGSGWFFDGGIVHSRENPDGEVDEYDFPLVETVRQPWESA